MQSRIFNFGFLVIFACILFSCTGSKYRLSTYFNPEKMVPADFDPKKQVLLVVEFPKKNQPNERHVAATNKMEKILEKYYPYKYEIVSRKDILEPGSKYSDTVKYKYVVMDFMGQRQVTTTTTMVTKDFGRTSVSPTATTTTHRFHFYDRNSGKNYPGSDISTSNYGEGFTEFVKVILRAKGTTAFK